MDISISIDNCIETIQKSQKILNEVFVKEQGIPLELDLDGQDDRSYHALAHTGSKAVGTARLTVVDDKQAVLAKVAVIKESRGSGIGNQLVRSLLSYAKNLKIRVIEIHAHQYLRKYYESLGFNYVRDVEVVGEYQLIEMRLN